MRSSVAERASGGGRGDGWIMSRMQSLLPLTDAIEALERRTGQPISYEDPIPASAVKAITPRSVPPRGAGAADELTELVERHRRETGNVFTIERTAFGQHVIPVGRELPDGGFEPWVALLDVSILPAPGACEALYAEERAVVPEIPGSRAVVYAITCLVAAVAASTSFNIMPGSLPTNFVYQKEAALLSCRLPAREHLIALLSQLPRRLSWSLFGDEFVALLHLKLL
ncbi:hypothetical protein BE21_49930 [Sorangium cellulosum]|uniref:Uncharacterized protein n=1 Tax=Sorangium cellulosum TaxID=56 RepID=A0A150TGM7_SORCE|nr:hypothetical protein BE21_49930 [Sorangium cellulosum]